MRSIQAVQAGKAGAVLASIDRDRPKTTGRRMGIACDPTDPENR
jgi:hypothetical protein